MKNKTKFALVSALSLGLILGGCGKTGEEGKNEEKVQTEAENNTQSQDTENDKKEDEKAEESKEEAGESLDEVSLSDWEGEWNNMGAYLEKDEIQDAFKTLADKEGITEEEAKANYLEKRACEFDGLVIEGNHVKFMKDIPEKAADLLGEGDYKFVEKKEVEHGSHKMEWDIFEAEADAPYKYILMMPIHGEESLTHYHMRYGDDKDELLAKEGWYPTFVKPTTTDGQIIDEITE